jgi:FlaG/FlaF family flagellin (archaellin)
MASRAHAPRRASSARRRPAARKRRPAQRRGGTRIKWDRIGRIALVVVLGAVIYSYLNPAIDFVKTYTATTSAKAKLHEELRQNRRLHREVQSADEAIVINRKARAQGMVAPGEAPIVVRGLGG